MINRSEFFNSAVLDAMRGLRDVEINVVNDQLAAAPSVVVYDEDAVVTAYVELPSGLVLRVQDADAAISLELSRHTRAELVDLIRAEHAWESVIGPNPFDVPVDDDGAVLPVERVRASGPPALRRTPRMP